MKASPGIRTYLSMSHVFLVLLSLVLVAVLWFQHEEQEVGQGLRDEMENRASALARSVGSDVNYHVPTSLATLPFPDTPLKADLIAVYVEDGSLIHELTGRPLSDDERDDILRFSQQYYHSGDDAAWIEETSEDGGEMYSLALVKSDRGERLGVICLTLPLRQLRGYFSRLRFMLAGAIVGVLILGLLINTAFTRVINNRLSEAKQLAATVVQGNYHSRIPEKGPRELQELARYLNQMAQKLEEQERTRRTILANVTHELARPLAGLRVAVESLRKSSTRSPEFAEDLLTDMIQTIQRMEIMIDDISLAARPQSQPILLDRTSIAVEPFLRGLASRFWTRAETCGVRIEVEIPADMPSVFADEKRLNQILGNLVDNAIKFTHPGNRVLLTAERGDEGFVHLMVLDGGDGISEQEVSDMFKPFYQGQSGRRIRQGMGLGLSIASQLAELHGGKIELKNHPQGGALAILTLPGSPS